MIFDLFELLSSFVIDIISAAGYFGIFLTMTLESMAIPIPSEIIMPFSGFLAWEGRFNFFLVVFWGVAGNLTGSIILYLIGYYGGRRFLERYGRWFLISRHDLEIADRLFAKYGQGIIFFSRMLPVVRTYISFPAGVGRMDFKKFSFYTFAGSIPWAILLTQIGALMGESWWKMETYFRKFDFVAAVLILILAGWWVRRHLDLRKYELKQP